MYGEKRTCGACGCKFYDLGKTEPVCPKCNTVWKKSLKKAPKPKVTKTYTEDLDIDSLDNVDDDSDYIGISGDDDVDSESGNIWE